jgi:hypothetical protein
MAGINEAFKQRMSEWISLKAQLAAIRKDTSVLTKREKELRELLKTDMKQAEIDTVNVRDKVKVNLKKKTTKQTISKPVMGMINKGLSSYFGGDLARVEGATQAILDSAPEPKENEVISVHGLKVSSE